MPSFVLRKVSKRDGLKTARGGASAARGSFSRRPHALVRRLAFTHRAGPATCGWWFTTWSPLTRWLSAGLLSNDLPPCFNGVCRQISTAVPFDKVTAIGNLHKFALVSKCLKRLIAEIRAHIKTTNTTVVGNNG
jgi:hypothetical protein